MDLTKMSTEELLALRNKIAAGQSQGAPAAPTSLSTMQTVDTPYPVQGNAKAVAGSADLSSMSTADLLRMRAQLTGNKVPEGMSTFKLGKTKVTIDPDIGEKLILANADMMKETGKGLAINSSYRTKEQQEEAYKRYQNGEIALAAKPGTSRHEKGMAVDIENWKDAAPYLEKYGFENPFVNHGDPGHFQLMRGADKNKNAPAPPKWAQKVSGFTDWLESPPAPPKGTISDTAFRLIPEGVDKAAYQIAKGTVVTLPEQLGDTAQRVLSGKYKAEDLYTPYVDMLKGIYDAVGTPLGLNGIKAAQERFYNDPGGAFVALATVFSPLAKGKAEAPYKPSETGIGENLRPAEQPASPLTPVSKSAKESAEVFIRELEKPKSAAESAQVFETAIQRGELPMEQPPVSSPGRAGIEKPPTESDFPYPAKTEIGESPVPPPYVRTPEEVAALKAQAERQIEEGAGRQRLKNSFVEGVEGGRQKVSQIAQQIPDRAEARRAKVGDLPKDTVESAREYASRISASINEARAKRGKVPLPDLSSEAGFLNIGDIAEWARELKQQAKFAGAKLTPDMRGWLNDVISHATQDESRINGTIGKYLYKALRPAVSGQRTFWGFKRYPEMGREAIKTIVQYKDELGGKLPESLGQFSEAVWTLKRKIFEQFNQKAVKAGGRGATVKFDSLADALEKEAKRYNGNPAFRARANYAQRQADWFREQGEMNVLDAQEQLAAYNAKMRGKEDYHTAGMSAVDGLIADHLRKSLDSSISEFEGPGYSKLKKQYGALTHIEKDINRRAVNEARAADKTLPDTISDTFTSGAFIHGMLSGHPSTMAASLIARAVTAYDKAMNSPSKQVAKMFKEVEAEMNPGRSALVINGLKNIAKEEIRTAADAAKSAGKKAEVIPPVSLGTERESEKRRRENNE